MIPGDEKRPKSPEYTSYRPVDDYEDPAGEAHPPPPPGGWPDPPMEDIPAPPPHGHHPHHHHHGHPWFGAGRGRRGGRGGGPFWRGFMPPFGPPHHPHHHRPETVSLEHGSPTPAGPFGHGRRGPWRFGIPHPPPPPGPGHPGPSHPGPGHPPPPGDHHRHRSPSPPPPPPPFGQGWDRQVSDWVTNAVQSTVSDVAQNMASVFGVPPPPPGRGPHPPHPPPPPYHPIHPPIDIISSEKSYTLYMDLPGLKKADVDISVTPDKVLVISGEFKPVIPRRSPTSPPSDDEGEGFIDVMDADHDYYDPGPSHPPPPPPPHGPPGPPPHGPHDDKHPVVLHERRVGKFVRKVTLPGWVNADEISATFEDGVLKIVFVKGESAKPKKVVIA